jgi:ABC-2 type transport system ATP-binding protein
MYLIEVGINNNSVSENEEISEKWMQNLLKPLEGIESVSLGNEFFQIQCSQDLSSAIAQKIVENGYGLSFLNKKEYGLDAIYNRYFEGGLNNG